jgi:hypothetical protein
MISMIWVRKICKENILIDRLIEGKILIQLMIRSIPKEFRTIGTNILIREITMISSMSRSMFKRILIIMIMSISRISKVFFVTSQICLNNESDDIIVFINFKNINLMWRVIKYQNWILEWTVCECCNLKVDYFKFFD